MLACSVAPAGDASKQLRRQRACSVLEIQRASHHLDHDDRCANSPALHVFQKSISAIVL